MHLTTEDQLLVVAARKVVKYIEIPGGVVGTVGAALRTTAGEIYTGVCMHLVCGLGTCAEYAAVASAFTSRAEFRVQTIVATKTTQIVAPCGRCREFLNVLSPESGQIEVILSDTEKQPLSELLPRAWSPA